MLTKEKADVLKAIRCLDICVSESVADDISIKVKSYIEKVEAERDELKAKLAKVETELVETEDEFGERIRELTGQLRIAYTERTECKAELAGRFAAGFTKGQESVKRKNPSGCCCIINDGDNSLESVCGAHADWRDAELVPLRNNLSFILDTYELMPEYAKKLKRLVEGKEC